MTPPRRGLLVSPMLLLLHLSSCTNPFSGADFLLSDEYAQHVAFSVEKAGGVHSDLGSTLSYAAGIPSAIWLDEISELATLTRNLENARRQQYETGKPTLVVIVIYNLPGRDCSAQSSAGELSVGELDRYKKEYLLPISLLSNEFHEVPKVFLLEPDSLPNLVTNTWAPKCKAAADDYKQGIAAAIETGLPLNVPARTTSPPAELKRDMRSARPPMPATAKPFPIALP